MVKRGDAGREYGKHEHRPYGEPAIAEAGDQAFPVPAPIEYLRHDREGRRERNQQRHVWQRGNEQQRHEGEPLGHDEPVPELEPDPGDEGVAEDHSQQQQGLRRSLGRQEQRQAPGNA
jgi:hypothetical protein